MRGFTLIEVMIAVFLLTVGIIGVMAMFPLAAQTIKSSQMASQALQLAGAKMEEMISKSYGDPALSPGVVTEDYGEIPDFGFHKRETKVACVSSGNLSEAECNYAPISDPFPMKKVEVTVFWRSRGGLVEKSVKVANLITKK